jgi:hypothetical protein
MALAVAHLISGCGTAATPAPSTVATIPSTAPASKASYSTTFGIDYAHPEAYVEQGEQSGISDPSQLDELRSDEQGLTHLGDIYRWLKHDFESYAAHGGTIGVVTVDELLAERRLGGCHDTALVYAAVVREMGYPAIMADTASIPWVERSQASEAGQHVGHVFVEVHLVDRWILVDPSNGWYVEHGYLPGNPVIPLTIGPAGSNPDIYGCYVLRKGSDSWACGIHSLGDLTEAMDSLASQLDLQTITYPEYTFQRFDG